MDNHYSYWENKKVTSEERAIVKYLTKLSNSSKLNILHIGIGCSYLLHRLHKKYSYIHGITIAGLEKTKADNCNISNNKNYLIDKYDNSKLKTSLINIEYDVLVDINLKSFSPDNTSFNSMFSTFVNKLNPGGFIITSKSGMNWSTNLELKNNILNQIGDNDRNILTKDELNELCQVHRLSINEIKITNGFFKKKTEELYLLRKQDE